MSSAFAFLEGVITSTLPCLDSCKTFTFALPFLVFYFLPLRAIIIFMSLGILCKIYFLNLNQK